MLEKIITSKTRAKLLKLFLIHIDNRYYLRELERKLDESLSPLRRQLIKLVEMGILITEEEANLKYYRLNLSFEGIEELRKLVLGGKDVIASGAKQSQTEIASSLLALRNDMPLSQPKPQPQVQPQTVPVAKRMRYDLILLSIVALFVLLTASFVVYTSSKNIKQVATLFEAKPSTTDVRGFASNNAKPTRPDEMVSMRWKILPGNYPALSTGETGGNRSEEL